MKKALWLSGFLLISLLTAVRPALADSSCSWLINANCSDVKGCQQASQESFCAGASTEKYKNQLKQKYASTKCCCCPEEVGCCSYKNRLDGKTYAKDTTIAECYSVAYFADVLKFDTKATANGNQCVAKSTGTGSGTGCCVCVNYFEAAITTFHAVANDQECQDLPGSCIFYAGKKVAPSGSGCVDPEPNNPKQQATSTKSDTVDPKSNAPQANVEVSFDFDPIGQENPLQTFDPSVVAGRVINGLMIILGTVAFAVAVYAGWLWMTARGNSKQISSSIQILVWMAAGLGLIFMAYVIVKFMLEIVGK